MKKILSSLVVALAIGSFAYAADLSVEAQFDVTGKDMSKGYMSFKGPVSSIEKDSVDTSTGASKAKATATWNANSQGPDKKTAIPAGIQSLFKYSVSAEKYWISDGINVSKAADGVITVQYVHRGTAYKIVTDKSGKLSLPNADAQKRTVAVLQADGSNYVGSDFSADHTVAKIDWKKVWDNSIQPADIAKVKSADGKESIVKSGAVVADVPASASAYEGVIQLTLTGNILTLKGDLNLKK